MIDKKTFYLLAVINNKKPPQFQMLQVCTDHNFVYDSVYKPIFAGEVSLMQYNSFIFSKRLLRNFISYTHI
jgi:hypothetical protein